MKQRMSHTGYGIPAWAACAQPSSAPHPAAAAIQQQQEGYPADQQRIVYGGKLLEDGWALHECGLRKRAFVHLVMRYRGD